MRTLPGNDTLLVVCAQTRYLRANDEYHMEDFVVVLKTLVSRALEARENIVFMQHSDGEGHFGPIHPDLLALTDGKPNILTLEEPDHRINRGPLSRVKERGATVRIVGRSATSMVLRVARHMLDGGFNASVVLEGIINRYGDSRAIPERDNDIQRVLEEYNQASLLERVDRSSYDPGADHTLFDLHKRVIAESLRTKE